METRRYDRRLQRHSRSKEYKIHSNKKIHYIEYNKRFINHQRWIYNNNNLKSIHPLCSIDFSDLNDDFYEIACATEELHNTASLLESKINEDLAAQLSWKPVNVVNVDEESAHKIIDMVNSLDDHDDVQEVFSNFDISEELLDKL